MSGPEIHFEYAAAGATGDGDRLTRDDAVTRLRTRAGDVIVVRYPGNVPVTVRAGQGLRGDPEVMADGWGYAPPSKATQISEALAEAAAVAQEAAA